MKYRLRYNIGTSYETFNTEEEAKQFMEQHSSDAEIEQFDETSRKYQLEQLMFLEECRDYMDWDYYRKLQAEYNSLP